MIPHARPTTSDKTFLALIFDAEGEGFTTAYGHEGCQDLRRNALYTWLKRAIQQEKWADIDFLEILVSVVQQLYEDFPDLKIFEYPKWVMAKDRLPDHTDNVHVRWEGVFGKAGGFFNRNWIEDKLWDSYTRNLQWLQDPQD